jgi:ribulose-5-phosphate 4-epimerase/fuculose-1-phosphate aldolase
VPSGSPEMTKRIPMHLEDNVAMMIHGHGVFARGVNPEEAFYRVAATESSGVTLWMLRMYGIDSGAVADLIDAEPEKHLPVVPTPFTADGDGECDFADEPDTAAEFLKTGKRIFESRISTFHSGSMSLRGARTLLYAPKAAMPRGLPGPLREHPLTADAGDNAELEFHKMIYAHSNFQAVMHTYTAEAEAAAWAAHPKFVGTAGLVMHENHVIPIDAEGSFLYLKTPLLQPDASFEAILTALHDYHIVIVRGRGMWAVGEQSLSEALHHVSSVRDICYYRAGAAMRRLNFANLEPEKAKNW